MLHVALSSFSNCGLLWIAQYKDITAVLSISPWDFPQHCETVVIWQTYA